MPAITERLSETLSKLNAPVGSASQRQADAADWWRELGQRLNPLAWVDLETMGPLDGDLPADVFTGVIDNLVRNAAEKHLREPDLRLGIRLSVVDDECELVVCDNGTAMADRLASSLFLGPVASESGYGIGLYQASRHAGAAGYRLELIENRTGRVCFRLAKTPALGGAATRDPSR